MRVRRDVGWTGVGGVVRFLQFCTHVSFPLSLWRGPDHTRTEEDTLLEEASPETTSIPLILPVLVVLYQYPYRLCLAPLH